MHVNVLTLDVALDVEIVKSSVLMSASQRFRCICCNVVTGDTSTFRTPYLKLMTPLLAFDLTFMYDYNYCFLLQLLLLGPLDM